VAGDSAEDLVTLLSVLEDEVEALPAQTHNLQPDVPKLKSPLVDLRYVLNFHLLDRILRYREERLKVKAPVSHQQKADDVHERNDPTDLQRRLDQLLLEDRHLRHIEPELGLVEVQDRLELLLGLEPLVTVL